MTFIEYLRDNAEEINKIQENPADSLSRQGVIDAFNDDLFKGFTACLQWSGFQDMEQINNNREDVVKLLEKAKECLLKEELHGAISLRQSKVFGKALDLSYWSRALYFISKLLGCAEF